jgi:hypothetical protein
MQKLYFNGPVYTNTDIELNISLYVWGLFSDIQSQLKCCEHLSFTINFIQNELRMIILRVIILNMRSIIKSNNYVYAHLIFFMLALKLLYFSLNIPALSLHSTV